MIPPLIVEEALQHGIQWIAITDHNATANIAVVQKAAQGTGLAVMPGMELQTREEVHSLCLFDTLEQAQALQDWVDRLLPDMANNPDFFGEQFVVDETGDFIRREERLLLTSVDATLSEAYELVHNLGGLFIPAHINRQAFGLMAVLGLLPTDFPLEVLEISRHISPDEAVKRFPQLKGMPLIQNGDVHFLDDFLGAVSWTVEGATIEEIRQSIHCHNGRKFNIDNPHSLR
jgi:3',5'-nucleoside bisphosphate phosphatase